MSRFKKERVIFKERQVKSALKTLIGCAQKELRTYKGFFEKHLIDKYVILKKGILEEQAMGYVVH